MKRSEINAALREMEQMVREYRFALPPFCGFTPEEWAEKGHDYDEIRDNMLGWDITGGACMTIAGAMLCLDHVLNALAPRLAGKFQVSTTVIKMIPLALMAVCGAAAGLMNGRMAENFATMSAGAISTGEGLMASTVAVAFAYEGWILATSINAELRDAKRTLPRALVAGAFIVVATYILYYVGLTGAVTTEELMASGEAAAKMAFQRVFGETAC